MSTIAVLHNNTGSRAYRLNAGIKELKEREHTVLVPDDTSDPRLAAQLIREADTILFQMVWSLELVKLAKSLGKRVVFEVDDLLHKVPKSHYSYEELNGLKGLKWLLTVFRCLRLADGFICTNEELSRRYGRLCGGPTLVWPNRCDLIHWLKPLRENMGPDVRLLWAGSTSHTGDLDAFRPVLKRILDRYPQVKFVYIGHGGIASDDLYAKFVYGEDLFPELPPVRRESCLAVPPEVWPYVLNGLVADLAVAPLVRNEFNRAKSQCKFIEYAVNAIPGVYSRWFYTDVKEGLTGFTADTEDEWVEAIGRLVEDRELRKRMGLAARKDIIENFDVKPQVGEWADFLLGE